MIRVRPTVNGWELIENTRSSLIYEAVELGLSIFLTRLYGVWNIKYVHNGETLGEDESTRKSDVVSKAKGFMHENPGSLDTVPVIQPGEEFHFDPGKLKNPKRVTQFSRYER